MTPSERDAMAEARLSYGELLRLTEGHGTGEIYGRIAHALRERDEAVAEALDALAGTHFHHKAFEPLCRHCQDADARLRGPGEGA